MVVEIGVNDMFSKEDLSNIEKTIMKCFDGSIHNDSIFCINMLRLEYEKLDDTSRRLAFQKICKFVKQNYDLNEEFSSKYYQTRDKLNVVYDRIGSLLEEANPHTRDY